MTMRARKAAFTMAAVLLLVLTGAALFIAWFQVHDCADALRRTHPLFDRELNRSLAPQCAAYREQNTRIRWLSLAALLSSIILWWLPRRWNRLA
jgi:hypothetical protein